MILNPGKKSCHNNRLNKLLNFIKNKGIQNLIVLKDENIFYLTGFYGKNSGSLLLFASGKIYLLVNFIYLEQAKRTVFSNKVEIIEYSKDKYTKLVEILEGHDNEVVGVESSAINAADYLSLKDLLKKRGAALKEINGAIERLRAVKDETEISNIKNACRITDDVFSGMIESGFDFFKGESESSLALKMEKKLIESGADGKSFDMIIANNEGSSMPHYISSRKNIENGLLLMDFGCGYNNYFSDITRTIFLKKYRKLDKFRKIYDIVLQAQTFALENCKEGITGNDLDNIARKYISKNGFGENFRHGLGHGVGLEVHEDPIVSRGRDNVLKENMVVTIEPGIYIEGSGGIRIEDMVLIKKNCCEVLYSSLKDLIIL